MRRPILAALALLAALLAPGLARGEGASAVQPGCAVKKKPAGKPAMAGVLNVNRATEAELRLLPGIGKGRAQKILERRDRRPFASLDEVARIKGLKGVIRKLRRHLVVEGDSTLRPAE
jgi:competence protein ComEA